MAKIIQNRLHQAIGDGARATKFNFYLYTDDGHDVNQTLLSSVKSCTTPSISHSPITILHKGRPIPVRGTTNYEQSFSVTFYLSEDHFVEKFFEA